MEHHNADGSDPRPSVPPTLHVPRPAEAVLVDELSMLHDQLRWKPRETANSLGGILVHMGYGERPTRFSHRAP